MDQVRVVSFNIHHGTVGAGPVVDAAQLGAVCAGFEADVLALQEVDRFAGRSGRVDLAEVVAEATGMAVAFGRAHTLGDGGEYGNALLVRGSLRDVSVDGLPHQRLGGGSERRATVSAVAGLPGGDVRVVATHLSTRPDERDRQLDAALRRVVSRRSACILLGDLNAGPDVVCAPVLAAGLALADATLPTFPVAAPRARIDHVAVAGFEVVAVAAPPTAMSDHRPLVVDLAWRSGPAEPDRPR